MTIFRMDLGKVMGLCLLFVTGDLNIVRNVKLRDLLS